MCLTSTSPSVFHFPFGYSIIHNIRNQLALTGTPSTSTKWAGEPHKHLTLFKLPFICLHHCTTLQHHTARPSRTSTSRTMTSPWTPAMAQTAAANSPAPFQQMVKLRADTIRQGLLPPTAIDGSHPNESYGDRLAREILYITHTGLLQDFNNWKSIHRPQPPTTKEELDRTLQRYFDDDTSNHLSMTPRTNFSKYMLDFYDVANTYTAQKMQCQYCKKRFAKHFLMPMYPKLLHRTDANTYLFCWGWPPSSQWPRSHDPPWPMAEHNQGIRGCQHDPDP